MAIKAEFITSATLPAVLAWWPARGCGVMPEGVLPPCGAVSIDTAGQPVAAGFAYFAEGCRVAFLDWFVTRPGLTAAVCRRHLARVLGLLEAECEQRAVRWVLASTAFAAMSREAQKWGFLEVETRAIHLIKNLKP